METSEYLRGKIAALEELRWNVGLSQAAHSLIVDKLTAYGEQLRAIDQAPVAAGTTWELVDACEKALVDAENLLGQYGARLKQVSDARKLIAAARKAGGAPSVGEQLRHVLGDAITAAEKAEEELRIRMGRPVDGWEES